LLVKKAYGGWKKDFRYFLWYTRHNSTIFMLRYVQFSPQCMQLTDRAPYGNSPALSIIKFQIQYI